MEVDHVAKPERYTGTNFAPEIEGNKVSDLHRHSTQKDRDNREFPERPNDPHR
jgi:hypothetical protein